jgi:hypothetical protein
MLIKEQAAADRTRSQYEQWPDVVSDDDLWLKTPKRCACPAPSRNDRPGSTETGRADNLDGGARSA